MNKRLKDWRNMGVSELNIKLTELKNTLAKEQAVKSTNTRPENPGLPRHLRRQIARIHTIVKEKQKPSEVKQ